MLTNRKMKTYKRYSTLRVNGQSLSESQCSRAFFENMSSRILAIFAVAFTIFSSTASAPAVSKARQLLPALPGYIPVYIRSGDTPLEDINPDLAAAFNSYAKKHARLAFARSNSIPDTEDKSTEVKDISLVDDLTLEDENIVTTSTSPKTSNESEHIQKIPKH